MKITLQKVPAVLLSLFGLECIDGGMKSRKSILKRPVKEEKPPNKEKGLDGLACADG